MDPNQPHVQNQQPAWNPPPAAPHPHVAPAGAPVANGDKMGLLGLTAAIFHSLIFISAALRVAVTVASSTKWILIFLLIASFLVFAVGAVTSFLGYSKSKQSGKVSRPALLGLTLSAFNLIWVVMAIGILIEL